MRKGRTITPRVWRVSRVAFPTPKPRRIVADMSTEPLPSLADLLADADRVEHDAIALSRSFPRALGRTLHLAARAGAVNRRAVSLNTELARAGVARRVAPVVSAVPLGVVDPMFHALLDASPVEAREGCGCGDPVLTAEACHGAPQRLHEAVGIVAEAAGGRGGPPRWGGVVRG